MRTANELTIRGERVQLERLLARVETLLRDGWKRDQEAEERLGRRGGLQPSAYSFSCTSKGDRPAAAFWVHARGPNELYIADVIPLQKQELSEDEAHRVLMEFEQNILDAAAHEVGVETKIVQHRLTLEHDLSPEAVRRLRAFSAAANRTCLQPNDRRRWNAFLVQLHKDEALFEPALLDAWLQQEGWPAETRRQLVAEHETARSLLLTYDEQAERR
jgi:hypothetical protein